MERKRGICGLGKCLIVNLHVIVFVIQIFLFLFFCFSIVVFKIMNLYMILFVI